MIVERSKLTLSLTCFTNGICSLCIYLFSQLGLLLFIFLVSHCLLHCIFRLIEPQEKCPTQCLYLCIFFCKLAQSQGRTFPRFFYFYTFLFTISLFCVLFLCLREVLIYEVIGGINTQLVVVKFYLLP